MKRFIESVRSTGCNLKNDKGRALWEYCKNKWEHVLLNDDDAVATMMVDIGKKVDKLNKQYPRLKQNFEMVKAPSYRGSHLCSYYVRWMDKNCTTAFVIHTINVVGVLANGELTREQCK